MPADPLPAPAPARRTVLTGDGVAWLRQAALPGTHAVVTSLPDVSEVPRLGLPGWRAWFVETAALICAQVAPEAVAVFYQTDIRRDGRWIDKGALVAEGAARASSACLFHRIVCRVPAGRPTFGRPGYAHLMAFSREHRVSAREEAADVLPGLGGMPWVRAMGTAACEEVCRFLLRSTGCRVVVDPFCGWGTMLAVANAYGLDALGVELSGRRASRARTLSFRPAQGPA